MQIFHQALLLSIAVKLATATSNISQSILSDAKGSPLRTKAGSPDLSLRLGSKLGASAGKRPVWEANVPPLKEARVEQMGPFDHTLGSSQWAEDAAGKIWLSLAHPGQSSSTANIRQPSRYKEAATSARSMKRGRAEQFFKEWTSQNLGPHLDPDELAKKVRSIGVKGASASFKARYSTPLLLKSSSLNPANERGIWCARRQKRVENQKAFWQFWHERGLGKHIEPGNLAKAVRGIQVDRPHLQPSGLWVNKHLADDPEYLIQYGIAQRSLIERLDPMKKIFKKNDADFENLPRSQQDHLVLNHLLDVDAAKKATIQYPIAETQNKGPKDRVRRGKGQSIIARVGQVFESHFIKLKIDPDNLSPKDLEEATRGLRLDDIPKQRFGILSQKYLKNRLYPRIHSSFRYYRKMHHQENQKAKEKMLKAEQGQIKGKAVN